MQVKVFVYVSIASSTFILIYRVSIAKPMGFFLQVEFSKSDEMEKLHIFFLSCLQSEEFLVWMPWTKCLPNWWRRTLLHPSTHVEVLWQCGRMQCWRVAWLSERTIADVTCRHTWQSMVTRRLLKKADGVRKREVLISSWAWFDRKKLQCVLQGRVLGSRHTVTGFHAELKSWELLPAAFRECFALSVRSVEGRTGLMTGRAQILVRVNVERKVKGPHFVVGLGTALSSFAENWLWRKQIVKKTISLLSSWRVITFYTVIEKMTHVPLALIRPPDHVWAPRYQDWRKKLVPFRHIKSTLGHIKPWWFCPRRDMHTKAYIWYVTAICEPKARQAATLFFTQLTYWRESKYVRSIYEKPHRSAPLSDLELELSSSSFASMSIGIGIASKEPLVISSLAGAAWRQRSRPR